MSAAFAEDSEFDTEKKAAVLKQTLMVNLRKRNSKSWDEASALWIDIADNFCRFKKEEKKSETCLQLAETILLTLLDIKVENEFSVRPRNMFRAFETWENVYSAVVEACSGNSDRCCTFAVMLADEMLQVIERDEMDCRLLFVYSHIVRTQIECFDFDILSDVFIGDFDVSGKGNVLSDFCKLLIELRKRLAEMLCKYSDKRTGIAVELLSKSTLNIVEGATFLISEMTKPAHIIFIIGALAKFMGDCIALTTEKDCRMLSKNLTNVTSMVKTALNTLREHYSGPYGTSLLRQLEPLFISGLHCTRIRQLIINFWQQTFARCSHLDLSDELSCALEQSNCAPTSFNPGQKSLSMPGDSTRSIVSCDTNLDVSTDTSSSSEKTHKKFTFKRSKKPPVSQRKTPLVRANENSAEEYAVIEAPPTEKKMRLTDRQKEKLLEKRDSLLCIAEDSQSIDLQARLPPGYTADSSSTNGLNQTVKVAEQTNGLKKCDSADVTVSVSHRQSENQDLSTRRGGIHVGDTTDCNFGSNIEKNSLGIQDARAEKIDGTNEDRSDVCEDKKKSEGSVSESEIVLPVEATEAQESRIPNAATSSRRCETADNAQEGFVGGSLEEDLDEPPRSPNENLNEPPRTPNSIMKKFGKKSEYTGIKFFSASGKKCKRVHFDASTLDDDDLYGQPRTKIFRRKKSLLFPDLDLEGSRRPRPISPAKRPPPLRVNKDPARALFPLLVECEEIIPPQIYLKLAPAMSSLALRSLMKSRGVVTVGDLACLSEQDLETFPFRDPKLSRFQKTLDDHYRMKIKMCKRDAEELEEFMKRSPKSSADCSAEVAAETKSCTLVNEHAFSKDAQGRHVAATPEKIGTVSEVSGITSEICAYKEVKHSGTSVEERRENPFQCGSKRFTASLVKRCGNFEFTERTQPESEGHEIMPLSGAKRQNRTAFGRVDDLFRFGFRHPYVRNQKTAEGEIGNETTVESDEKNATAVSESDSSHSTKAEDRFRVQSPGKEPKEKMNTKQNIMPREHNKNDNVNDSVKKALHSFQENPAVAAIAGADGTEKFNAEQLLSFLQACAALQTTALTSYVQKLKESED